MTRTDDRGWFTLKGVPEGFVRPIVFPDSEPLFEAREGLSALPYAFDQVICEYGLPVDVGGLLLRPPGTVTGTLTGPDGKRVPRSDIRVIRGDGLTGMVKQTRKNGTFTLTLPPGPYLLNFLNSHKIGCVEKEVRVESGKATAMQVELPPE